MRPQGKLIAWIVTAVLIIVLLIVSKNYLGRPSVSVIVPNGADTVTFDKISGSTNEQLTIKKTGKVRMPVGSYAVTYSKDGRTVGMEKAKVKATFSQTIEQTITQPTTTLHTLLYQQAQMITPLGSGYLYKNNQSGGVEYVDANGVADISEKLIMQNFPDNSDDPLYTAVTAITPITDNEAAITTTNGIFVATGPGTITPLRPSDKEILSFTSSSYDAKTKRLFVIGAFSHQVYVYDMTKLKDAPKPFYKTNFDINRVSAGGGKVVIYFDDLPSTQQSVVDAYSKTKQVNPLLVNAEDGKLIKKLDQWQPLTMASLSPDGQFMLLKKKFATTMQIVSLQDDTVYDIPATDTNTVAWHGDKLYFARDGSIWSVNPANSKDKVTCETIVGDNAVQLQFVGDTMLVTTANGFTRSSDASVSALGDNLQKLSLTDNNNYTLTYLVNGSTAYVTANLKGDVSADGSSSILTNELSTAKDALKNYAADPSVVLKSRDVTLLAPYKYSGIPPDFDDQ